MDDVLIAASADPHRRPVWYFWLRPTGMSFARAVADCRITASWRFDTADLASLESDGRLLGVILHEMGHVLGIGTIWETFGLLFGAGTS